VAIALRACFSRAHRRQSAGAKNFQRNFRRCAGRTERGFSPTALTSFGIELRSNFHVLRLLLTCLLDAI
jgi:hypothetical protein